MTHETQNSIVLWADSTFGSCDVDAASRRALQEISELEIELEGYPEQSKRVAGEMADVVITLYRLATCLGFDLHDEIDRKMVVNRERKWTSNGDGTGQHVKEPS